MPDFLPNSKNSVLVLKFHPDVRTFWSQGDSGRPGVTEDNGRKPWKPRWRTGTWDLARNGPMGKIRGGFGSGRWSMVKASCWNNSNACNQRNRSASSSWQRMRYSWFRDAFYSSQVLYGYLLMPGRGRKGPDGAGPDGSDIYDKNSELRIRFDIKIYFTNKNAWRGDRWSLRTCLKPT